MLSSETRDEAQAQAQVAVSAATFAALCPLMLQLLAVPVLRCKTLGCLLLRRLLSVDSTTLASAAFEVLPAAFLSLSCCDDSAEWSGVVLSLSRCIDGLLAAVPSLSVGIAHTHKLIVFHCERVALKQSFRSLWAVGTALLPSLSQLAPAFLSLHSTALADMALAMLNSWHLRVQDHGMWLLALLLGLPDRASALPVPKVAVELLRVYIFYSTRAADAEPGSPGLALALAAGRGGNQDALAVPDLSSASAEARGAFVARLEGLCSAVRSALPQHWDAAVEAVVAEIEAGKGGGAGAEKARALTLGRVRELQAKAKAQVQS